MSDIMGNVVGGLVQYMRANGYSGIPTVGLAIGAVNAYIDSVKGDYARGDYAALAVDAFVATGALGAGLR